MQKILTEVLEAYHIPLGTCSIQSFGSGLINNTWKINNASKQYILQRINEKVFANPEDIADNIKLIGGYLSKDNAAYLFVAPLETNDGKQMFYHAAGGYFRLFLFIENSHTIDVVENVQQAYEAAKQFATFTNHLSHFDAGQLKITLPDFHNLSLRYQQFENAMQNGNAERIEESKESIDFIRQQKIIVDEFEKIKSNPRFKLRVTHHDTKISNVLFDKHGKGLCVIDLDTVMPGYFISDVGDMLRTYLSPVSEEEKDFSRVEVRDDYFEAIVEGYLSEMRNELSIDEKNYFVYAGKFMIYMQAIRFLTDYLGNDIYYGAKYEGHNLYRAKNQIELLKKLIEKESLFNAMVNRK